MRTAPHLAAGPQSPTEQHGNGDCKRQETEAPSSQTASASHLDLNFPLPGEKGPSCLVKVRCVTNRWMIDLTSNICSKQWFQRWYYHYQQIFTTTEAKMCVVVGRCTRTGTASNWTTRWRSTASCLSARLSVLWPTKSKTRFRAGFPCGGDVRVLVLIVGVHTETPPRPSWTRRSAWRPQRSRECTARRPLSSPASTCSTPGRCRTTTPCCP